jgi:hypothetical protein
VDQSGSGWELFILFTIYREHRRQTDQMGYSSSMSFDGAQLKIGRAIHHIEELNARVAGFENSEFYGLTIDRHPDPLEKNLVVLRIIEDAPVEEYAPIIGDAIHNLRSALDHAWYQVIRKKVPAALK